ncbi:PepSY domain-containing protein [Curtobacterium sp. VKM Ac-2922]|uniref:PepSY domain-containing protein n=1 Tax=Curtobacterium sp. VKM Ac-2922 TaxID=2929475 RepID=UPI001FB2CA6A|nr:PepSY domain-containing protein [Curtobacterium sp. VKM Ac-2922]MCJ1713314.1 PepSY domain-containing protein [Curtobacterium sp. VKM Ac-2922]
MMITDMTRTSRIALSAAVLLAGGLAVSGCADADDPSDGATVAAGDTPGGATTAPSAAARSNDALVDAAATARKAVGSGTVVSIEQERNGSAWEVLVVAEDGTEREVHTDAAGTGAEGAPRTDGTDPDDVEENQRIVDAAELDVAEAADRLTGAVAGSVTELGLDDHAGTVVWEGDVRDASGTKHSIRIDAGSGDVVTNTVDTDD